jgi:hypothetical protein
VEVCDYRWRGILVDLVTAVAPEAIVRYLVTGAKEDNSVTLGDLRVNREAQE